MKNKNKKIVGISMMFIIIFLIIGFSYAYFSANITGSEETTTITVTGGVMNITYNGGSIINASNIVPSDSLFAVKTFTVTGNNTTDTEMYYEVSLIVEENTFSEEALKYKLISANTNNNGNIIPSITDLSNLESGSQTIILGIGNFDSPTDGNKIHTYNLELYFPETNVNQNIDQGKSIKAYIDIKGTKKPIPKLTDSILAQGGGINTIINRGTPDFSNINGSNGIYASTDDYGTSYYYRGLKDEINNNLIWAGFQWKIIRINGNGSIRLIYNGTENQFNTAGNVNSTGLDTQIAKTFWNDTYKNDAKYVGYMYGGENGTSSAIRNGFTSAAATYNETNSNIKTFLDNWYKINIFDKGYSDMVVDTIFCNDRQLQNEVGGDITGPGYGNVGDYTYYAAYYRLVTNKEPTLKCGLKNDRFTVNDIKLGNGSLTYPISMITADEESMAGLKRDASNLTNYLYTNQQYWSISPHIMDSSGRTSMFYVGSDGDLGVVDYVTDTRGVRPVISISSSTRVTGAGSATDPYKVLSI